MRLIDVHNIGDLVITINGVQYFKAEDIYGQPTVDAIPKDIFRNIRGEIEKTPSADIVEVVRCKNCKHYESDGGALMQCGVSGITVNDEDYCSYGERIEE